MPLIIALLTANLAATVYTARKVLWTSRQNQTTFGYLGRMFSEVRGRSVR